MDLETAPVDMARPADPPAGDRAWQRNRNADIERAFTGTLLALAITVRLAAEATALSGSFAEALGLLAGAAFGALILKKRLERRAWVPLAVAIDREWVHFRFKDGAESYPYDGLAAVKANPSPFRGGPSLELASSSGTSAVIHYIGLPLASQIEHAFAASQFRARARLGPSVGPPGPVAAPLPARWDFVVLPDGRVVDEEPYYGPAGAGINPARNLWMSLPWQTTAAAGAVLLLALVDIGLVLWFMSTLTRFPYANPAEWAIGPLGAALTLYTVYLSNQLLSGKSGHSIMITAPWGPSRSDLESVVDAAAAAVGLAVQRRDRAAKRTTWSFAHSMRVSCGAEIAETTPVVHVRTTGPANADLHRLFKGAVLVRVQGRWATSPQATASPPVHAWRTADAAPGSPPEGPGFPGP